MQYLRKLTTQEQYLRMVIPAQLSHIFSTDMAVIEPLPDGRGITVRPARIEAI
jgi:hypothetical protein